MLDDRVVTATTDLIAETSGSRGLAVHQFDVISGLAGVGAYLLSRRRSPVMAALLASLLGCLIDLASDEAGLPNWYTPPRFMQSDTALLYPYGHLNCGFAHGIPGPLALCSIAVSSDVEVPGLRNAVRHTATWLVRHHLEDRWGVNWPTMIPLEPAPEGRGDESAGLAIASHPQQPSRAAWCYGAPGVARSLWLAGQALDDEECRSLALSAMSAVYQRPLVARQIDSPTFCHGVAGLLQITLRFAHDTRLPIFADAAAALCDQLLALYDPTLPLGYYKLEPSGARVDDAGFLDGVPSIPLVLLAAAMPEEPLWDRLFLLA